MSYYTCKVEIEEYKPGAWEVKTDKGFALGSLEPAKGLFVAYTADTDRASVVPTDRDTAIKELLDYIGFRKAAE